MPVKAASSLCQAIIQLRKHITIYTPYALCMCYSHVQGQNLQSKYYFYRLKITACDQPFEPCQTFLFLSGY